MAFSDFKYPDLVAQFGLTRESVEDLFAGVPPVPPGEGLRAALPANVRLASVVSTEKARSEWMVAPILSDLWARYHGQIGVYSGANFSADPEAGLTGYCDYLLCRSPQQPDPDPPVLVAFEAKNEDIRGGLGQCVAAMIGAERYNRREGRRLDAVFGCVTSGTAWRFLRLSGGVVTLDLREYGIGEVDRLLGILVHIAGPPPV